jgi:curved DNA-binding protein CbpA
MAGDDLAFQYILVAIGLAAFLYFAYEYVLKASEIISTVTWFAKRVVPSCVDPSFLTRATMIVPLYTTTGSYLTLRGAMRFWIKEGFKLVFMLLFVIYFSNVWSASLADDPFTIVGVSSSATKAQVRRACRQGSLKLHPDKHPGKEEEIRPIFEKHTRACKVLNDEKLREKYVKFGILPSADQKQDGAAPMGYSQGTLSFGQGGLSSILMYFLIFVGGPSMLAYYGSEHVVEESVRLKGIQSSVTDISTDLQALFKYKHLPGLTVADFTLDVAELYIRVALAEFDDYNNAARALRPRQAAVLTSLRQNFSKRFQLWMDRKPAEDDECTKVDKLITQNHEQIYKLVDSKKGSGK